MQNSQTEPSTPFRSLGALTNPPKNAHLNKPRISAIHLPRHGLCDVLTEFLQRRALRERVASLPTAENKLIVLPKPQVQSLAKRLSSHGTNSPKKSHNSQVATRRRRRSSSAAYESLCTENVSKDFLRTFSRTIVRENGGPAKDISMDISFSDPILGQTEPKLMKEDLTHQFDQSLPLPAGNHMITPINLRSAGTRRNLRVRREYDFMKYLDHAAEGDGNVFRKDYTSVFETEDSTPRSRQEPHFHSDSGADYLGYRSDFERAILYSRQALSVMDPPFSNRPFSAIGGSSSDGICRPLMDFDDQEVFSNLNLSSSHLGSTVRGTLSRSIADSPFFLKKTAGSPDETVETAKATSPLTPLRNKSDYATIVTPPNLVGIDHQPAQGLNQGNVSRNATVTRESAGKSLKSNEEEDAATITVTTRLSLNSESKILLETDQDSQTNKFPFNSSEVVPSENKSSDTASAISPDSSEKLHF